MVSRLVVAKITFQLAIGNDKIVTINYTKWNIDSFYNTLSMATINNSEMFGSGKVASPFVNVFIILTTRNQVIRCINLIKSIGFW